MEPTENGLSDAELLDDAVFWNKVEVFQKLLARKVDVNTVVKELTPLHRALAHLDNREEFVKELIKAGADVNSKCVDLTTIYWTVSPSTQSINNLKFLLSAGANVNTRTKDNRGRFSRTPLHIAVYERNLEAVKILLSYGADINAQDDKGNTPLFDLLNTPFDVEREMLKVLLLARPDLNITNNYGQTFLSRKLYNTEISELLLQANADVNQKLDHRYGNTPLYEVLNLNSCNTLDGTVKLLLKYGADVNIENDKGEVPIHLTFDDLKNTQLLIDAGADVNKIDHQGQSVMHKTDSGEDSGRCLNGIEMVKFLMGHGEILDLKDNEGNTPFQIACDFRRDKLAKFLGDTGANVNNKRNDGRTPLHMVVLLRNPTMTEYLLSRGADVNAVDNSNLTPLHLDKVRSSNELIDQLSNVSKIILEHIAKLQALDLQVNENIFEFISENSKYNDYFQNCRTELQEAKRCKPKNCWISYFNLLVDDRRKLKNYVGYKDLVDDIENSDCLNKFPIYGERMVKNVEKGKKRRELFEEAATLLSDYLPIFNPDHLIVRDILDRMLSIEDLSKLCLPIINGVNEYSRTSRNVHLAPCPWKTSDIVQRSKMPTGTMREVLRPGEWTMHEVLL